MCILFICLFDLPFSVNRTSFCCCCWTFSLPLLWTELNWIEKTENVLCNREFYLFNHFDMILNGKRLNTHNISTWNCSFTCIHEKSEFIRYCLLRVRSFMFYLRPFFFSSFYSKVLSFLTRFYALAMGFFSRVHNNNNNKNQKQKKNYKKFNYQIFLESIRKYFFVW